VIKVSLLKAIRYYQKTGGSQRYFALTCNFSPTCSEYTYQVLSKFGVIKGLSLGFKRICRCSDRDCFQVVVDPIPEDGVLSSGE